MKDNKKVISLLAITFLLAAPTVFAQPVDAGGGAATQPGEMQAPPDRRQECPCARQRAHKRMLWKLTYQLSLNEDQAKQLEALVQKQREGRQDSREQMQIIREALEQAMVQDPLDMEKINKLHAQLKEVQAQMADARFNAALEARKMLTADQYVRFVELIRERSPWGHKGFRRGGAAGHWQARGPQQEDVPGDLGRRPPRPHPDAEDRGDSPDEE